MEIKILDRKIGLEHPTYFIADIAANHDGDLDRAIELIRLAAVAGADGAKFQNFRAPQIVSDYGFKNMDDQVSHQASWKKSVVEVYDGASIPFEWTPTLKDACEEFNVHYFSSPYDYEAIDMLDEYVPAYKAGSGLISWPEAIMIMARKGKPLLIATGASDMEDVDRVMQELITINQQIILMQCNTNYTADETNYDHLNINVLQTYAEKYPDAVLGLSDHTHSNAPVVGAVAMGARVIERHFTDDNNREGPDHKFALNPTNWAKMVADVRILERTLGNGVKRLAENEKETYIIQRRCLRASRDIKAGEIFSRDMLEILRPATHGALMAWDIDKVIGRKAKSAMPFGKDIRTEDLE